MNGELRRPPELEMRSDREARNGRPLSEAIAEMISAYFGVTVEGEVLDRMTATVNYHMAGAPGREERIA